MLCGPKLSLCVILLSVWGIVQLVSSPPPGHPQWDSNCYSSSSRASWASSSPFTVWPLPRICLWMNIIAVHRNSMLQPIWLMNRVPSTAGSLRLCTSSPWSFHYNNSMRIVADRCTESRSGIKIHSKFQVVCNVRKSIRGGCACDARRWLPVDLGWKTQFVLNTNRRGGISLATISCHRTHIVSLAQPTSAGRQQTPSPAPATPIKCTVMKWYQSSEFNIPLNIYLMQNTIIKWRGLLGEWIKIYVITYPFFIFHSLIESCWEEEKEVEEEEKWQNCCSYPVVLASPFTLSCSSSTKLSLFCSIWIFAGDKRYNIFRILGRCKPIWIKCYFTHATRVTYPA